jgi:glucose-6-phosphate dehydrogenase assembly protein OpcA
MPNHGKDWRELCAAAAKEPDSKKLVSLINQILEALEKRDPLAAPLSAPRDR